MDYYIYITNVGVPQTGLFPKWEYLYESDGIDIIAAANNDAPITEIGGGFYKFSITFGNSPWTSTTKSLVGVINTDPNPSDLINLTGTEKYIPIEITLAGLSGARITHKGIQNKTSGNVDIYNIDGAAKEMKLAFSDDATHITRDPTVA